MLLLAIKIICNANSLARLGRPAVNLVIVYGVANLPLRAHRASAPSRGTIAALQLCERAACKITAE